MVLKTLRHVPQSIWAAVFLLATTQTASASDGKHTNKSKPPVIGISSNEIKPSQPVAPVVRDHRLFRTKTIVSGGERAIDTRNGGDHGSTRAGVTVSSSPRTETKTRTKHVPCIGNLCGAGNAASALFRTFKNLF